MPRRLATLLALIVGVLGGGCGTSEPNVSREVKPGRSEAGPATIADPGAATRPPRAIATH